jgi:uncharacterized membrane protein YhiD involved in acid resistance
VLTPYNSLFAAIGLSQANCSIYAPLVLTIFVFFGLSILNNLFSKNIQTKSKKDEGNAIQAAKEKEELKEMVAEFQKLKDFVHFPKENKLIENNVFDDKYGDEAVSGNAVKYLEEGNDGNNKWLANSKKVLPDDF